MTNTIKVGNLEMDIRPDGFISWSSDWDAVRQFVKYGAVKVETSKKRGDMGHTDYYLKLKIRLTNRQTGKQELVSPETAQTRIETDLAAGGELFRDLMLNNSTIVTSSAVYERHIEGLS